MFSQKIKIQNAPIKLKNNNKSKKHIFKKDTIRIEKDTEKTIGSYFGNHQNIIMSLVNINLFLGLYGF